MLLLVECVVCRELVSSDGQQAHKDTKHQGEESVTFKEYNVFDQSPLEPTTIDSESPLEPTTIDSESPLEPTTSDVPLEEESKEYLGCDQSVDVAVTNTVGQHDVTEAKEEPMEIGEENEALPELIIENEPLSTSELNIEKEAPVATSELKIENEELSTSVEERIARERLSTSELRIENEELEEMEECEEGEEVEPLENDVDDLSLPAIKRRPTRTIKPVVDKETAVKFVDSDASSDEEDLEWDDEGKAKVEEESGSEKDSSSESESDEEGEEGDDLSTFVSASQEDEDEEKKRVQITEADMPFLFEKRAPGKRQIKVIEFSNELVEKAAVMSDESSSDDEDWRAKQEDITEQLHQEDDEEVVDMEDIPVAEGDDTKPVEVKSMATIEKPKSKLSHDEALQVSLCCVCLMGIDEDNVMECDNCGVTIHEGCYGHPPTDPDDPSTDLCWFCEPCVANIEPCCELCPDKGGVMKRTDTGKFCHMVCALYTSGVGFEDTTLLQPIITTDFPPSKWGSKKCDLCEDKRFSYTGLVVECEAGLCKSHFHITCAQKLGYLMETTSYDMKADPFFAYCKIHVDKDAARAKKKLYHKLADHVAAYRSLKRPNSILQQLEIQRKAYTEKRKLLEVPAIMTERHPRALFGSPSAFAKLTRKAEMFGLDTNVVIVDDTVDMPSQRKKDVKPALSAEFSTQYIVRQTHIKTARARYDQLNLQILSLKEEEHELQTKIPLIDKDIKVAGLEFEKARQQALSIWSLIAEVDKTKRVPKCISSAKKKHVSIKSLVPPSLLKNCKICKSHEDKEMMVDCDNCGNYFHFKCLNPPLTRSPKINKKWAWYCQRCNQKKDDQIHLPKSEWEKNGVGEGPSSKFGRSIKKPEVYTAAGHKDSSSSSGSSSDSSEDEVAVKRPATEGVRRPLLDNNKSSFYKSLEKGRQAIKKSDEVLKGLKESSKGPAQCKKCKKIESSGEEKKMLVCIHCDDHVHMECVKRTKFRSNYECINCVFKKPVHSQIDRNRLVEEWPGYVYEPKKAGRPPKSRDSTPPAEKVTETKKHRNIFDLKFRDKTVSPVKAVKQPTEEPPAVETKKEIPAPTTQSNTLSALPEDPKVVDQEMKTEDPADEGIVLYISAKNIEDGNSYSVSTAEGGAMVRESVNEADGGVSIEISADVLHSGQEILIKQSTLETELKDHNKIIEDKVEQSITESVKQIYEPEASVAGPEEFFDAQADLPMDTEEATDNAPAADEAPVSSNLPVVEHQPNNPLEDPSAPEEPPKLLSEDLPAVKEPTKSPAKPSNSLLVSYAASSDDSSEDTPPQLPPLISTDMMDFTQDKANFIEESTAPLNESFGEKSMAVNALLAMSQGNFSLVDTKKLLVELNDAKESQAPAPPPVFVPPPPPPIITNYNPTTTPRVIPQDFYESMSRSDDRYQDIPDFEDADDV